MMSVENEEEFEIFYDFSKQYANMNLKKKTKALPQSSAEEILALAETGHDMEYERKEDKIKGDDAIEKVSEDDWEDCDIEDAKKEENSDAKKEDKTDAK